MKAITKILALGVALAVSTSLAYADPLLGPGAIGITHTPSGQAEISWTATGLSYSGGDAVVNGATGSLGSFIGDTSDVFGFNFSSISSSSPFLMYTANDGADTLDFYLTSLSVITDTSSTLLLNGAGYFTEAGYANTPASLILSASASGPSGFILTNYETTSGIAPEPSSLLLLGTGLLCAAEVARRKFAAKVAL